MENIEIEKIYAQKPEYPEKNEVASVEQEVELTEQTEPESKIEDEKKQTKVKDFINFKNTLKVKASIRQQCSGCLINLGFPFEVPDVNKYHTYPNVVKSNRVIALPDFERPWVDSDMMFFCDGCFTKVANTIRLGCLQKIDKMKEEMRKKAEECEKIMNGEKLEEEIKN